ncbi:MAG: alpha/beta hydrolase [Granulosicoccus sp.]
MIINRVKLLASACLLFTATVAASVFPAPVTVTLGELDAAIGQMQDNPDAIEHLVRARLEQALADAELTFSEGELLFSKTSENLITDDSCTRTEVRQIQSTAALSSDTALNFILQSINDPIELSLDIAARINVDGRAKQTFGFRLGRCQPLAEDNFSFSATGQVELSLSLRLALNPVLEVSQQRLVLQPSISLGGTLGSHNFRVDVDDSLLRSVLESILEDEIDDALSDNNLSTALLRMETDLKQSLESHLEQGRLIVDLPVPNDEQVSRLYSLLSPEGDFSLSRGYIRVKRVELLAALVTGDEDALQELLTNAAVCTAAALLQSPLEYTPVFLLENDGCETLADGQLADGELADNTTVYGDAQCLNTLDFLPTSEIDYCNYVLDSERLGNAESNPETLNRWTLSPGTTFDIGALPLSGLAQPFTQRVKFKQVSTAQGECSLEMRIHTLTPSVSGTPLKPLLAFHGGSWQRRSSGALGIESIATVFANQGYVVFAPFYRLINTEEGNAACNDATLVDVLDDASDALDWVQANAARYGAVGKPVVFGQSAGGHMSAVLAVERPEDITSAVLFYAPTDFTDFARQILSGEIDSKTGQGILETVVGQTLETLDLDAPLIRRNTLTDRIVSSTASLPPFFLLHGMQDTVLPFNQSVRLCNALSGNPDNGAATTELASDSSDPFKRIVLCDFMGSELHLITEGEHALDLCISEDLCLAGSPLSARSTSESVQRMLDWLKLMHADNEMAMLPNDGNNDTSVSSSSGTTGLTSILALLTALLAKFFARFRTVLIPRRARPWCTLSG